MERELVANFFISETKRDFEPAQSQAQLGVPNSQAGVIISPAQTDGLTVLATGQRQYAKLVQYQPSYNTSHNMKSRNPLRLADGNLRCRLVAPPRNFSKLMKVKFDVIVTQLYHRFWPPQLIWIPENDSKYFNDSSPRKSVAND